MGGIYCEFIYCNSFGLMDLKSSFFWVEDVFISFWVEDIFIGVENVFVGVEDVLFGISND